MSHSLLTSTVANFSLFKDFALEEVRRIVLLSETKELRVGELLIAPGQKNQTLYLLIHGELMVIIEKDGTQVDIPIHPGESLGEMSLVMDVPTSAMARANSSSQVLLIPKDVFWSQIAMKRQGVQNLMSMMAQRLHRNNHALIKEVEEQLKYQHLEKELDTAGKIQANIVPDGSSLFINRPEIDVHALMNQAREVGGDFFDAQSLDQDHIYVAIGDASGKGMPAALFMMRAFTSLRLIISNQPDFEKVMPRVNAMLVKDNDDMMFVSIFVGVLNLKTGIFRFVNGGHNPPFCALNGEKFKLMDVPKGTIVGVLDEGLFTVREIQLRPNDTIVLYTDGVPEATRSDQVQFNTDRALLALNGTTQPSMKKLVTTLEGAIDTFVAAAPQHDDLTILAMRYRGNDNLEK
ncbi:MAG: SpoIIE family protein phosphatase [Bacteroidota bacterium]